MKGARSHSRPVAAAAALAAGGILASLGILHADRVREEAEVLWFRLAGGVVISPRSTAEIGALVDIEAREVEVGDIVQFLADATGRKILVDASRRDSLGNTITIASRMHAVTGAMSMRILEANRFGFEERATGGGCYVLTTRQAWCSVDEPMEWGLRPLPGAGAQRREP